MNRDPSTTLPPVADPPEQFSEEYLSLAASYPPRKGHLIQHARCSSGKGHFGTARKALTWKGASSLGMCLTESSESASVQEVERMGKQPRQMVAQSLASLGQSAHKGKPWDKLKVLTPSTQTRRAKATHQQGGEQKGTLGP